jgi:YfiH family protein
MRWIERDGLRYVQFARLGAIPGLWHGIFTRHCLDGRGGAFSGFNIGLNVGDSDAKVHHNRRRMLTVAGSRTAVFARQVHGDQVAIWDRSATDNPTAQGRDVVYLEGDALVTDQPGVALVIQTADCQSVLLADVERGVIANVHSGWRGSIADIVGRTVGTMVSQFGCLPENIVAGIGPSLGPCCAEFINYRDEIPPVFWHYRGPGDRFDFWRLSIDQLVSVGVPDRQISLSNICTRCNTSTFFSHRGESGRAGRFASVILLKE